MITRRIFLKSTPAALAVGATVAAPAIIEAQPRADLTAIPTDAYDAIMAWQTAQRRNAAATNVYSASLRSKPVDPEVSGPAFMAMVHSEREVGPAREAMIAALLGLRDGGVQ